MGGAHTYCILSWLIAMQFSCPKQLRVSPQRPYIHIRQWCACGCGTLLKGSAKGIVVGGICQLVYILLSKWLWWLLLTVAVPSPMPVLGTGLVLYALRICIVCFRRNRPYFGRMCVRVTYGSITKHVYIWSCAVTETMAWEKYHIYSRNSRTFLTKILYLNLGCVIYARKQFYVGL